MLKFSYLRVQTINDMDTTFPLRPMPKAYRLCVKTDCPRAAQCLRSVALSSTIFFLRRYQYQIISVW